MQIIKSDLLENTTPLVSVDIITYNHERYISEAIEGVLMQKVDFLIEIVICDDCSTDHTRNILLNYQKEYPNKIVLRFQDVNVGLRNNYFENKAACRGKYIAICEGDDYWTDANKLQKQVDFLENNSQYSMIFTNAMEVYDYKNWHKEQSPFSILENREYSGFELFKWIVPTATVVYRNEINYNFKRIDQFLFYDIVLFLRIYEMGKIRALNEITAVYRRHENSITNQEISYKKYLTHLKAINEEFGGKYDSVLPHYYADQYFQLSKMYYKKRSFKVFYFTFLSLYFDSSIMIPLFRRKLMKLFYRDSSIKSIIF